jgi:hypothetical protein
MLEPPQDFREPLSPFMISNERPSPFRQPPQARPRYQAQPRPTIQEDILKSSQVQIERKTFVFLLKENPRGRFLRIIEQGGRSSTSIIIPADGLKEFQTLLDDLTVASRLLPEKPPQ